MTDFIDEVLATGPNIREVSLCVECKRLRTLNGELAKALENCTNQLWDALGGDDDPDNRRRANNICKEYRAALAAAKE